MPASESGARVSYNLDGDANLARITKQSRKKAASARPLAAGDADQNASRSDRIARLLSELAELMRQEGLDKEALHHLRQIQMRVKFAGLNPHPTTDVVPDSPPSKWLERKNTAESPVDFIVREYAPWLGKGLTRAHLRQLDFSLYEALKHWLKKNSLPKNLDLPTKKEMIDRKLATHKNIALSHTAEQLEKLRLYQAARRRALKKPS